MINHVKKVWGSEDWLVNNDKYCAKYLNLKSGFECSVHYHMLKDETFYVLSGDIKLYVVDLQKFHACEVMMDNNGPAAYHDTVRNIRHFLVEQLQVVTLHPGDQYRLKPFVAHKFTAISDEAKILEISTTHFEEDSYRLTESGKVDY